MSEYAKSVNQSARESWGERKSKAIRRWGGLDRLVAKASVETATKFAQAAEKYRVALQSGEGFEVARRAGVLERGLDVVEREALDAGWSPSDFTWFDLRVSVDGKRAVAVIEAADAEIVAASLREELDEEIVVYTAADIVLMAQEHQSTLHHLKRIASAYTRSVVDEKVGDAPW